VGGKSAVPLRPMPAIIVKGTREKKRTQKQGDLAKDISFSAGCYSYGPKRGDNGGEKKTRKSRINYGTIAPLH